MFGGGSVRSSRRGWRGRSPHAGQGWTLRRDGPLPWRRPRGPLPARHPSRLPPSPPGWRARHGAGRQGQDVACSCLPTVGRATDCQGLEKACGSADLADGPVERHTARRGRMPFRPGLWSTSTGKDCPIDVRRGNDVDQFGGAHDDGAHATGSRVTFGSAMTRPRKSSSPISAGTSTRSRTLPRICTTQVTFSSTR